MLVGFMGAGKTAVGRELSARLDLPFVDLDREIERAAGTSIRQLFETRGEKTFREMEKSALDAALVGASAVVAAGGGVVEDGVNRALLENATVVFLDAPLEEALARIGSDRGRPMLVRSDPSELYARRRPLYASVADVVVDTSGRTVDEVVKEVAEHVAAERPA